jgi:lipopolysaccharide biosynthesis glycosyltransferase
MFDKMVSNIEIAYAENSNGYIIVYASDDQFADILGVSLVSLFENNKNGDEIIVFILDDKISNKNKNKLIKIFNRYNGKYQFIDVSQLIVPELFISSRWSKSAFTRLFMSELLPENISKVLYLDCDTLINQSLEEIWHIDMANNIIAGVNDCLSSGYKKNLGMNTESPYINSGVILIDLNKFRKFNCGTKIAQFIERHGKTIRYPDQDIINGLFEGNILILEPMFNSMTIFYDFTYENMLKYRKPDFYYSKEQIQKAVLNPCIIHFTSSFLSVRPWVKGSKHPYVNKYFLYKTLTPWINKEVSNDNRGNIKKIYSKIFNILPAPLSIGFSGWLHGYLLPWINQLKK